MAVRRIVGLVLVCAFMTSFAAEAKAIVVSTFKHNRREDDFIEGLFKVESPADPTTDDGDVELAIADPFNWPGGVLENVVPVYMMGDDGTQVGNGSATYIGDGWVVTAAHVGLAPGTTPLINWNEQFYEPIAGSAVQMRNPDWFIAANAGNPDFTEYADLMMYQIDLVPLNNDFLPPAYLEPRIDSLQNIQIAEPGEGPIFNESVILAGAGFDVQDLDFDDAPDLHFWHTKITDDILELEETDIDNAEFIGFLRNDDEIHPTVRWGRNEVSGFDAVIQEGLFSTLVFETTFEPNIYADGMGEGTAVQGDSGGAVFDAEGRLIGVVDFRQHVSPLQLEEMVFFGEVAAYADLSFYYDQMKAVYPGLNGVEPVPEPAALALALIGGIALLPQIRRRRQLS
ncbi:MAG: hypothetical protein MPJ24_08375 [Pirellulaceae bacterium]|nr:hypothetical protein [Pirellulaceae bacterium]